MFPRHFFEYLKMNPKSFYLEAKPTWKLGIRFIWGPQHDFFYTFAYEFEKRQPELARNNGFYYDPAQPWLGHASAYMAHERVFPRQPNGMPRFHNNHAFHIENVLFVKWLENRCREEGVIIQDATVTAEAGPQGVAALITETGERITGDLYIDASGFRSELLGRLLHEPFRSYTDSLYCDRAVIGGWQRGADEPIKPYTTAETMDCGWSWQIDHEHHINRGYVYSSSFISDDAAREERVRMTKLRQTIARRLKDAQNTAAMLTTFNEVDMTNVMALRNSYKDLFEKKHGVKLGFMGFFVKACIQALKEIPAVNAEIDGTDLVYKNYYHVGVAVGTEKGLVVPVIRDADQLSIAGIEKQIGDFGRRARDGQLKIEEMQGGTFTISNGGVYGSLMSTPILNAPQSGILGMHKIQERPVAVNGQVVIRPMMYLALSYDHRIVDGKEAVTFLVRVKESLEAPERLVLDL